VIPVGRQLGQTRTVPAAPRLPTARPIDISRPMFTTLALQNSWSLVFGSPKVAAAAATLAVQVRLHALDRGRLAISPGKSGCCRRSFGGGGLQLVLVRADADLPDLARRPHACQRERALSARGGGEHGLCGLGWEATVRPGRKAGGLERRAVPIGDRANEVATGRGSAEMRPEAVEEPHGQFHGAGDQVARPQSPRFCLRSGSGWRRPPSGTPGRRSWSGLDTELGASRA
jgi:hypothetical protein